MTSKDSLFRIRDEDKENLFLYHPALEEMCEGMPTFKSRILQGFGMIGMLVLGAAALAPNALHISAGFRPWVFIVFILWIIFYCAGIFNP